MWRAIGGFFKTLFWEPRVHVPTTWSAGLISGFRTEASRVLKTTHRLQSSSFLGLPYGIRNINHKKELLWSLWVEVSIQV